MSAISILLLGTVALTNVALVGYLLADRNRTVKSAKEDIPEPPAESPPVESSPAVQPKPSRVGESKFDVDEFMKKFERLEQGVLRMNRTLDRLEGDVRFKDVEFANEEDRPSDEEIANDEATSVETSYNNAQVATENIDKVFEDVRIEDFDGDSVSSPSATGFTTEEIEDSVNIAGNPHSTPEEKAKAGRVLISLRDTNFSDTILSDEKIQDELRECYRLSLRSEIADKESRRPEKKTSLSVSTASPVLPPQVPPKKKGFHVPENFDDFNPEDLFRK